MKKAWVCIAVFMWVLATVTGVSAEQQIKIFNGGHYTLKLVQSDELTILNDPSMELNWSFESDKLLLLGSSNSYVRFLANTPGLIKASFFNRNSKTQIASAEIQVLPFTMETDRKTIFVGETVNLRFPGWSKSFKCQGTIYGNALGGVENSRVIKTICQESGISEKIAPSRPGTLNFSFAQYDAFGNPVIDKTGKQVLASVAITVLPKPTPATPFSASLVVDNKDYSTATIGDTGALLEIKGGTKPYTITPGSPTITTRNTFAPEGSEIWILLGTQPGTFNVKVADAAGATKTVQVKVVPGKTITPTWGAETQVFYVWNSLSQGVGGKSPSFTVQKSLMLTKITNTHFNLRKGAPPGQISLRDATGKIYGPWQATGSAAANVNNAIWTVTPNVAIPAGQYTVIDSSPGTWSQNAQTGGLGFTSISGKLQQ